MTLFPVAHVCGFTFSCFSVTLNCMAIALKFKLYEIRALYEAQVLILIYIYMYCTMLIIDNWYNYLRF